MLEPVRMIIDINSDGSEVKVKVQGVKGKTCLEKTKAFEAAIGDVTGRTLTDDYHKQVQIGQTQSVHG